MKKLFTPVLLFMLAINAMGQAKKFDIVSYHPPVNWKQSDDDSYVAYSKTDGTTWAQMAIYKSTTSKGDIESDLDKEWEAVAFALHAVANEENTKIDTANGWMTKSRSGIWKYQGTDVATILTVLSNGKVCISLLCNATAAHYFQDFQQLVTSIKWEQEPFSSSPFKPLKK